MDELFWNRPSTVILWYHTNMDIQSRNGAVRLDTGVTLALAGRGVLYYIAHADCIKRKQVGQPLLSPSPRWLGIWAPGVGLWGWWLSINLPGGPIGHTFYWANPFIPKFKECILLAYV